MEESSPLLVSQRLNRQTIILKKLPQLLHQKLNISPQDFLLLSAFVGYIYDFKLINITETETTSPVQSFLDILEILRTRYKLKDLLDLLLDDGELDPYSRSVQEYHNIIDKIIGLLGGESEGRTHILYSVADIARGELPQDKSDQKLLSLKTKNSIDTLICLTGLASLSGIRADLPELEQVKLSERISQTVSESQEADAILKVLKIDKNAFEAILKTIFTPGLMSASSLFRALHLETTLFSNTNLKYLIDIMLKSRGSPAAYHANQDNQSFLKPSQKIPIPSTITNPAQTEVLQLAMALRQGDISALYDYPNHKFHFPSQREQGAKLLSITSQLLALINPRSSRPLYDTFRALMVEIGNQNACNAMKLAALDMGTLLDIEETCGILKESLAGVLISVEQFPCNMKAVWIERAVLKRIRGHDSFAFQQHYSEDDYIEQATFLESGRDVDYKNTERDYYETAVFNKFANYGYKSKVELLKSEFGISEEEMSLFLGQDQTEYYQHFSNVWGQDLNESQLIYKVDTEEAQIPRKKIDLITLKKQKSGSRPGSPVLSTDSVKGPFSACAGSLRRRWTKEADRDFVENIWKGMVVPLTKMGNVLVGDLIFAFHILALRNIARNPQKVRTDRDAYNKMLHRIDDVIHYLELQGLSSCALSESFDKYRLVKLIAMSLGVKISAKAQLWFLESVSNQFKKELIGNQESKDQMKRDQVLEQTILHQQVGYEWNEIVDFYKNQRDAQDLANLYHLCYPYERETMLDQEKEYEKYDESSYQISRWIRLSLEKIGDKEEISKLKSTNAALMFKTMSVCEKMIGSPAPHRDPCSGLPIKDVLDYFRILQQYLVVESQSYELLLGLSEANLNSWVGAYPFLKATGTLLQGGELELGNSVMQLISLRSQFQAAIRSKFASGGEVEDWEVPVEQEEGNEEEKEQKLEEAPQQESQMPPVKDVVAPLLQGIKTNVEHFGELLSYCLGSPNSHSYDQIQVALQLTPQILQLLHTSAFSLSRVVIPSLRGDFDYPLEGIEDDQEEDRINEVIEQYDEFAEQLSVDQPRPFSTRVLSGLAFLPYNRKLALKKLFLELDRPSEDQEHANEAQQTPRLTPDKKIGNIMEAPLSLRGLFKLIHFDLDKRRAKERDRRLSAQVPITRSNFFEGGSKLQKFQKDFIFDLPELMDSIHQESTQKQLIVSHILVALIQAVGLECIEDAITTLNFLQNSSEVDEVLYDYIQQLIFERFDMLEVKNKLEQLRKFDRANAGEEEESEEIKFEHNSQASPTKDVFDQKNDGLGKQQPQDSSPFKAEEPTKEKTTPSAVPDTIERVTVLPKDVRDEGETKEEVKALMPEKLVEAGGNEKSMVKAILGEQEVDASFESIKSNKGSAQPAPRIQTKVQPVKVSKEQESKTSMSNLLRKFESRSILRISDDGYTMSVLGVIDGEYSVLKFYQACIRFSDVFEMKDQEDKQTLERRLNNTRSTLVSPIEIQRKLRLMKSECTLENAQFRRFNLTRGDIDPSLTNSLKCELIYPASSEQVMKERSSKTYMIDETAQIYETHTLNIIQGLPENNDQWIRNVLEGGHERNRILVDTLGKEGFVLVLDYKYTSDMPDSMFHAVAIPRWPGLRTIRDLRAEHVGMLNQILASSFKAIEDEHQIASYELVAYFHYLPTFYTLHLHFAHVERASSSLQIGKAVTFRDVIQNLSFKSNYYQNAILSVRLDEAHPLAQKLMQEVLDSDLDDEDTEP